MSCQGQVHGSSSSLVGGLWVCKPGKQHRQDLRVPCTCRRVEGFLTRAVSCLHVYSALQQALHSSEVTTGCSQHHWALPLLSHCGSLCAVAKQCLQNRQMAALGRAVQRPPAASCLSLDVCAVRQEELNCLPVSALGDVVQRRGAIPGDGGRVRASSQQRSSSCAMTAPSSELQRHLLEAILQLDVRLGFQQQLDHLGMPSRSSTGQGRVASAVWQGQGQLQGSR
mmetsp:Transcript_4995/g.9417  ORF Transcript_4995/g.9417 Transcript_4995/m.9417 type:complete len:225 (+) Transcript_4995:334-1008(+)